MIITGSDFKPQIAPECPQCHSGCLTLKSEGVSMCCHCGHHFKPGFKVTYIPAQVIIESLKEETTK